MENQHQQRKERNKERDGIKERARCKRGASVAAARSRKPQPLVVVLCARIGVASVASPRASSIRHTTTSL